MRDNWEEQAETASNPLATRLYVTLILVLALIPIAAVARAHPVEAAPHHVTR